MTIAVELDNRPRKDGRCRVYVRVYHKKLVRRPLDILVKPSDWDAKRGRVKATATNALVFNRAITSAITHAEAFAADNQAASGAQIAANAVPKRTSGNFYQLAREAMVKSSVGYGTKRQRESDIAVIERLRPDLTLSDIDPQWIEALHKELRKTRSLNTATNKVRRLRTMFHLVTRDMDVADPFSKVRLKTEEPMRRGLMPEDVDRIEALDLSAYPYNVRTSRDVFMLGFYFAGMRWGDLCRLTTEHVVENELHYRASKSSSVRRWPIHPNAVSILTKYAGEGIGKHRFLLPFLRAEDLQSDERTTRRINYQLTGINEGLKVVAALAGTPPLTTYWSRHSLTVKAKLMGANLHELQDMLGHRKSATTDAYGKSLVGELAHTAFKKVFGQ